MDGAIDRRAFLRQVGGGLVTGVVASGLTAAECPTTLPAGTDTGPAPTGLPHRTLGRTGLNVPVLSIGTGPMGHAFYEQEQFDEVMEAAFAAGIRYVDTAPIYDVAQERLGPFLQRHRREIILASKSMKRDRDGVLRELEDTLRTLRTDYLDIGHLHNVGEFETEEAIGKGGALEGWLTARERGLVRHVGCTGHLRAHKFIPVLRTGAIEVLMVAMNFVDRFIYGFEETVLPLARETGCGIICMKVYGGVTGGWDGYYKKNPGRLVSDEHRQAAFDYALSLPGVATCVVGLKSREELRLAVEAVMRHRPLEGPRREAVLARGREMAREWGPHLGT